MDSVKAAILAGADAVYCGLDRFNARNRATNISFADLQGILREAHKRHCKVYLTLNIIIVEPEIPEFIRLLNSLINTSIDGVILQDLGMIYLVSTYFRSLDIHASTQLTTHNEGQILLLKQLSVSRVNLARELNMEEVKALTALGKKLQISTEVFVHGSYCLSFSGICYLSSVQGGNSGNRGRCSQPCRDRYITTPVGRNYPLNLKDNAAFFDLPQLVEAGVRSLKVEGRIKGPDYIYTVVGAYKKQIQRYYEHQSLSTDMGELYKVFNRDFSNSFLQGDLNRDQFIDNPRDHSVQHLTEVNDFPDAQAQESAVLKLLAEKKELKAELATKVDRISIAKAPLIICLSGEAGLPLKLTVHTPIQSFELQSDRNLTKEGKEALNQEMILRKFKSLEDTAYYLAQINLEGLTGRLFIPIGELSSLRKSLFGLLNNSRERMDPVKITLLKRHTKKEISPSLSLLISHPDDFGIVPEVLAQTCFQLPGGFKAMRSGLSEIFRKNSKLIPWFPAVLIGEDFSAAIEFLRQLKPDQLVSNNSGIGYEAYRLGIPWIAGPLLNLANSYSLVALKEQFNCSGAFISNELSKDQIKSIKKPDNFQLYYSLFHPLQVMTSRQCLFHQVTACEKTGMDKACIQDCEKSSSIRNERGEKLYIEKTRGNYPSVYHESDFLNMEIVADLPGFFSGYLIDFRKIQFRTKVEVDKSSLVQLFKNLIDGHPGAVQEIKRILPATTHSPYRKGI